jgi:hypothetical protein
MPNTRGVLIGLAAGLAPFGLTILYSLSPKSVVGPATISVATTLFFVTYVFFRSLPVHYVPEPIAYALERGLYGVGFGIIWGRGQEPATGPSWFVGLIPVVLATLVESGVAVTRYGALGLTTAAMMVGGYGAGFRLSYWFNRCLKHLRTVWRDLIEYREQFVTFIFGYVLIVVIFASLFAVVWRLDKDSLGKAFTSSPSLMNFLFFSLMTASTLGSADATPASPVARVLVSLEIIIGIFWITVVFARLSELAGGASRTRQIQKNRNAKYHH